LRRADSLRRRYYVHLSQCGAKAQHSVASAKQCKAVCIVLNPFGGSEVKKAEQSAFSSRCSPPLR
jgi:hypothetical protein